jgi:hypothetical protein
MNTEPSLVAYALTALMGTYALGTTCLLAEHRFRRCDKLYVLFIFALLIVGAIGLLWLTRALQ